MTKQLVGKWQSNNQSTAVIMFNIITPLSTGVVPNKLKIGKVIPIFKRGDSHLPNNYRPISLLSVFSKLLEKSYV